METEQQNRDVVGRGGGSIQEREKYKERKEEDEDE